LSISHLQNAIRQISSWITAGLLTLNSSKTEFLLIGLKQLAKLRHYNSSVVWIRRYGNGRRHWWRHTV